MTLNTALPLHCKESDELRVATWQTGHTLGGPAKHRPALLASVLFTTSLATGAPPPRRPARQEGATTRDAAVPAQVQTLEQGSAVERVMSSGEAHAYQLKLGAGQFAHLVVGQRGLDVAIRVYGPDGAQAAEVDGPSGMQGPEPVYLMAESAGVYRVEIRPVEEKVARELRGYAEGGASGDGPG